MASQVEIVNNSLQKCAEIRISSMSQDAKAAREATAAWNMARQSTLRMYRWNFAKRRAVLAPSAVAPAFGWTYQFPVPADFLELIGIYDNDSFENQQQYTSTRTEYVMEGTDTQRMIMCESNPLYITYIKDVTDTAQFDATYSEVLACHLAVKLAYALSTGLDRIPQIQQELAFWERKAKFSNAIENTPEHFESSDWVDSRYGDSGFLRRGPVA